MTWVKTENCQRKGMQSGNDSEKVFQSGFRLSGNSQDIIGQPSSFHFFKVATAPSRHSGAVSSPEVREHADVILYLHSHTRRGGVPTLANFPPPTSQRVGNDRSTTIDISSATNRATVSVCMQPTTAQPWTSQLPKDFPKLKPARSGFPSPHYNSTMREKRGPMGIHLHPPIT